MYNEILAENASFPSPTSISGPREGDPLQFLNAARAKKELEWWGYKAVKKLTISFNVFDTYRSLTDGQTPIDS